MPNLLINNIGPQLEENELKWFCDELKIKPLKICSLL